MILYTATKREFLDDVQNGYVFEKLKSALHKDDLSSKNNREYVSWENSLPALA